MNKEAAFKAMMQGHKVAHSHFSDEEYLHLVNNVVRDQKGDNLEAWFNAITQSTDWRMSGWYIVKICYECGKRIELVKEFTFDDLNYAHTDCLGVK